MRTIEKPPGFESYTVFEFDDDDPEKSRIIGTVFSLEDAKLMAAAKDMRDLLLDMDKQLNHAFHLRDTGQLDRDYLVDLGSYGLTIDRILSLMRMPK